MQYPHTTLGSLISPHSPISPAYPVCLRYSLSQVKECIHKYFFLFIKHCYGFGTQEVLMINFVAFYLFLRPFVSL